MLDESVPVLAALLAGKRCSIAASTLSLTTCFSDLDRPLFWFAARGDAHKSLQRASCYEGVSPDEMDAGRYDRLIETVVAERSGLDGFDIALSTTPGEPVADYPRETATWAIHAWPALPDTDAVFEIVTTGPPD